MRELSYEEKETIRCGLEALGVDIKHTIKLLGTSKIQVSVDILKERMAIIHKLQASLSKYATKVYVEE